MDTEIWISYNFYISQNIIILLIFFHKHLKTEKSHLAHGLHKTRQQAEFIPWSTVVCQPLLDDTEIDLSSFLLSGN